jgi:hypothetical protein
VFDPDTRDALDYAIAKALFGWRQDKRTVAVNPCAGLRAEAVEEAVLRDHHFTKGEASTILAAALAPQGGASVPSMRRPGMGPVAVHLLRGAGRRDHAAAPQGRATRG